MGTQFYNFQPPTLTLSHQTPSFLNHRCLYHVANKLKTYRGALTANRCRMADNRKLRTLMFGIVEASHVEGIWMTLSAGVYETGLQELNSLTL